MFEEVIASDFIENATLKINDCTTLSILCRRSLTSNKWFSFIQPCDILPFNNSLNDLRVNSNIFLTLFLALYSGSFGQISLA